MEGMRVSSSVGYGTSSIQLPQDPKGNPILKKHLQCILDLLLLDQQSGVSAEGDLTIS
jgi:hypothetical protein